MNEKQEEILHELKEIRTIMAATKVIANRAVSIFNKLEPRLEILEDKVDEYFNRT